MKIKSSIKKSFINPKIRGKFLLIILHIMIILYLQILKNILLKYYYNDIYFRLLNYINIINIYSKKNKNNKKKRTKTIKINRFIRDEQKSKQIYRIY